MNLKGAQIMCCVMSKRLGYATDMFLTGALANLALDDEHRLLLMDYVTYYELMPQLCNYIKIDVPGEADKVRHRRCKMRHFQ